MANVLEVVNPGPLSILQDLGRLGWMKYGVPPSGALDQEALAALVAAGLVNGPDLHRHPLVLEELQRGIDAVVRDLVAKGVAL